MRKAIPAIAFLLYGANAIKLENTESLEGSYIRAQYIRAQQEEGEEVDAGEINDA